MKTLAKYASGLVILFGVIAFVVHGCGDSPPEDKNSDGQTMENLTSTGDSSASEEDVVEAECIRTGCSSELCADTELNSTCEWVSVYACYETATCEKQKDGKCGFTLTSELNDCLKSQSIGDNPAKP